MVGVIGGIYGIGGGSILAPALVGLGFSVAEVAPAALASTFFTSIVGVLTYAVISLRHSGSIAPDWTVGIAIGIGGLFGGYVGTGLQHRVPEAALPEDARDRRDAAGHALPGPGHRLTRCSVCGRHGAQRSCTIGDGNLQEDIGDFVSRIPSTGRSPSPA